MITLFSKELEAREISGWGGGRGANETISLLKFISKG